jgi:hypothetical protein
LILKTYATVPEPIGDNLVTVTASQQIADAIQCQSIPIGTEVLVTGATLLGERIVGVGLARTDQSLQRPRDLRGS